MHASICAFALTEMPIGSAYKSDINLRGWRRTTEYLDKTRYCIAHELTKNPLCLSAVRHCMDIGL